MGIDELLGKLEEILEVTYPAIDQHLSRASSNEYSKSLHATEIGDALWAIMLVKTFLPTCARA